ncbi:MAG: hypothetical protein IT281_10285, partial [Ignavibacteria bacterium]|nr:hypothetical protein [Ignavibacteria bacterium]
MGSRNSRNDSPPGNANDITIDQDKFYSELFEACSHGSLTRVKELVEQSLATNVWSLDHSIKRQTCIQLALNNHHIETAKFLIQNYEPIERFIEEDMTKFLVENENFSGNFDERPNYVCVRQRLSKYEADIARRLKQIADAPWLLRPIIRAAIAQECIQDFQEIINEIKVTNKNTQKLEELFEKFVKKDCIVSLLCIYTLPTPVMSTIIRDNFISYATLIYMNLKTMKPNRSYQGRSYRAALVTSRDMINYRAAMVKGNLVETRLFSSTSKNRRVAETFTIGGQSCDSHLATIVFDFAERPCETALDLTLRRHE